MQPEIANDPGQVRLFDEMVWIGGPEALRVKLLERPAREFDLALAFFWSGLGSVHGHEISPLRASEQAASSQLPVHSPGILGPDIRNGTGEWPATPPRLEHELMAFRATRERRNRCGDQRRATGEIISNSSAAPSGAWKICWTIYPGRRSRTRFTLGYHLPGFQPFSISVNWRLKFAAFAA